MKAPKLLDQDRDAIRVRHYSIRTEEAYLQWIKRYIFFHKKQHPLDMGEAEITAFLSHLAVDKHVSASTSSPVGAFMFPSGSSGQGISGNYKFNRKISLSFCRLQTPADCIIGRHGYGRLTVICRLFGIGAVLQQQFQHLLVTVFGGGL